MAVVVDRPDQHSNGAIPSRHVHRNLDRAATGRNGRALPFNSRTNDWAKPESTHFVVGQSGEKFLGHSVVDRFVISPQFKFKVEDRARHDFITADMIKHDWAILILRDALDFKPIPIRPIQNAALPASGSGAEVALAGYGMDRQYVLSVHKGCFARVNSPDAGTITHMCNSMHGQSGGPILLLQDDKAVLIGIPFADAQRFKSQVGYQAISGHGVSASAFEKAAAEIELTTQSKSFGRRPPVYVAPLISVPSAGRTSSASLLQQARALGAPMAAVQRAIRDLAPAGPFPRKDALAVFDISQPSAKKRFYVLDLKSGQVTAHYAAHGRHNGPNARATKFKGFQTDLDMVPLGPLKTAHSEVMDPYNTDCGPLRRNRLSQT